MSKRRKKQGDVTKFTDLKGLVKALKHYGFQEIGSTNHTVIWEDAQGRRFRTPRLSTKAIDPRAIKNSSAALRNLLAGDDKTQSNPMMGCRLPRVRRRRVRRG